MTSFPASGYGKKLVSAKGGIPTLMVGGDSIGLEWGNMTCVSPLFWSQVRKPRRFNYMQGQIGSPATTGGNIAKSGSASGPLPGTSYTSTDGNDLNTPLKIVQGQAVGASLFISVIGTNDMPYAPVSLTTTYSNRKAFHDAMVSYGLLDHIVVPILPRYGSISATAVSAMLQDRANLKEWERVASTTAAQVHVLDLASSMIDDTITTANGNYSTTNNTGVAGSKTADGLHPATPFGRAAEPALTAMLDRIGAPEAQIRPVAAGDVYNASTLPSGNLLGTKGTMAGTGGTTANGTTILGVFATGWTVAPDPEIVVTGSKTTITADGNTFTAQRLSLSGVGGAATTATRKVTFTASFSSLPIGPEIYSQMLAQFANCAGVCAISLKIATSGGSGPWPYATMGGAPAQTLVAAHQFPTSGTAELMRYIMPAKIIALAGNTGGTITIEVDLCTGVVPAGDIDLAAVGAWPSAVLP